MEKIKVLHLIKSLGRGGAETLLVETLKSTMPQQLNFILTIFYHGKINWLMI
jgi:hypothetical protein